MPFVRITTNFELGSRKERLSSEFHQLMVKTAHTIEHARLIVFDEKPEAFFQPYNTNGNYAVVEISLFPGRSLETKRSLYHAIADLMEAYGVKPDNTRIVLYEVPRENWGLRGGQAASDIELGFNPYG